MNATPMLSDLPLALPLPTRGGSGLSCAGLFGLEGADQAGPHPRDGSLPGAVVVNRPLRDLKAKEPLARKVPPSCGKLGIGHRGNLKENCGIRKKRLDGLRNPQYHTPMTAATKIKTFRTKKAAEAAADECRRNGWRAGVIGSGPYRVDAISVSNGFRIAYDLHDDGKFYEYSRKEVLP